MKVCSVTLPVSAAAWTPGTPLPELRTVPLTGLAGASVRLRLVLVAAPSTPLRVLACTWNVGNAPPAEDLRSWLATSGSSPPDLVVVGAQECTYKEREGHLNCEADWEASLAATLGGDYSLVRGSSLGQMRLTVFARFDTRAGLHGLATGVEATGLGHVGSNKGGVCTVVHSWDTSYCFVNSHLAAHQNQVERRNSDYCEIVGSPNLELAEPGMDIMSQFQHVVWVGDLNYRLDLGSLFGEEAAKAKTPPQELFEHILKSVESTDFGSLMECDQLKAEIQAGHAYVGFQEGLPTFAPTFKVKREAGYVYDRKRSPAYCDRVLWRTMEGVTSAQESLWCASDVASSDHKPVASVLLLGRRPSRPAWAPRPELAQPRLSASARLPSHVSAKMLLSTWRLKFLSLSGHGLVGADFSGLSDPYCIFGGPALAHMVNTPYVEQTLDPVWTPDHLPVLRLIAPGAEELAGEAILVQVWDFDLVSQNDPIGNAAIQLGPLVRAALENGGEAEFEVQLNFQGTGAGSLKGRVFLQAHTEKVTVKEFVAAKRDIRLPAPSKGFGLRSIFAKPAAAPAHPGDVKHQHAHHALTPAAASTEEEEEEDD